MGSMFSSSTSSKSSSDYNVDEHGHSSRELYDSYLADDAQWVDDWTSKTVAITGTSTGSLGFYTAEIAVRKNAKKLWLCNRESKSANKGYEELLELAKEAKSTTTIEKVTCDLQDLESVKAAGAKLNDLAKKENGLDILILNAGVMANKDVRTKDGYDIQMQTNQLSHFLLTSIVWPSIVQAAKKRGGARVVSHSSSARSGGGGDLEEKYFMKCEPGTLGGDYWSDFMQFIVGKGSWVRYHQSKLANACFSMALHDKLQASNDDVLKSISASSADPGLASSNLQATTMKDGTTPGWMFKMLMRSGQSPADGSLPLGMAAFGKNTKSGSFFQPEKSFTGAPMATVEEGVANGKVNEKLVVSPKNKENVWKWCEEALGIDFKIE